MVHRNPEYYYDVIGLARPQCTSIVVEHNACFPDPHMRLRACIPQQETYYETPYHNREVVRVLIVDLAGIRVALATAAILKDSLTEVTRRAGWPEAASRRWHSDWD